MPTVVRLDQKRYLASGVDLKELFDQIPQPIAYFDANNRLGACNLSFRDAFPVVIESEFLKRASIGPANNQSNVSYGALARLGRNEPVQNANLPATLSTARGDFVPHTHKFPDGGTLLVLRVDRRMSWRDIARVMADAPDEDLDKFAATLRKRFERVKERLRDKLAPPTEPG